ncbi:MAG: DUF1573 domain-containing protein [Chthonomonadaceae bacterium]|nr:DUF1573 domain-containing protein [Chthonomonadaceae bacterium]
MPLGSSAEFQASAYKVEKFIENGEFEKAGQLLDQVSGLELTLVWDDKSLPDELKGVYIMAANEAIEEWKQSVPGLTVKYVPQGKLKVSFVETLPPAADSVMPAGATFFYSEAKGEPRVEAVIAQKRDTPPSQIDPRHVQNEVGYAIGTFLGVSPVPRPVGYMGRSDTLSKLYLRVNPRDLAIVKANLAFVAELKKAITNKTKFETRAPQMYLGTTELKGEDVHQGEPMEFSLEVSNRGNSPLRITSSVECGCIHIVPPQEIAVGQTGLVTIVVDTTELAGKFDKQFFLNSNDPDQSERRIKIKAWVEPRYRFLRKDGATTIVFNGDGAKEEFYLVYDKDRPFKLTALRLDGIKNICEFEEWEGDLADPQIGRGLTRQKGYKITVLPSTSDRGGRIPISFVANTDDPELKAIIGGFYGQWGIVANPPQVYFGEVNREKASASFVVTRPGKPFKILSVKCDSDFVKMSHESYKQGDYRVSLMILPTAPAGRFDAVVTVQTDDPKFHTVKVNIAAILK